MLRWKTIGTVIAILLVTGAATAVAGPKVYLGRTVAEPQQVSMDQVDHRVWNALLGRYVDLNGNVAYRVWQQNAADVKALDGYLSSLSTASTRKPASKQGQLAFWINAYNAVTIKGILREYPTSSIKNHTPVLYGYHIWKDLLLRVGGRAISLEQIEHDVLRKMGEPRIHFAIVCASKSCPRLLDEAYLGSRLEQQLVVNTKNFFANSDNFRHQGNHMQLSSILKWFAADFGSTKAKQLAAIAPYLPTRAAREAARTGGVSISYLAYDWSLNEQ